MNEPRDLVGKIGKCSKDEVMGICPGDTEANLNSSQWPQLGQSEQQNNVVLDYNAKYKINTHDSWSFINDQINKYTRKKRHISHTKNYK